VVHGNLAGAGKVMPEACARDFATDVGTVSVQL